MKYVIEFGNRGGTYCENLVIPTAALAARLAANLVHVFTNNIGHPSATAASWKLAKNQPRMTWTSATHFVSLSKLDGVMRGPASAELWRADE